MHGDVFDTPPYQIPNFLFFFLFANKNDLEKRERKMGGTMIEKPLHRVKSTPERGIRQTYG